MKKYLSLILIVSVLACYGELCTQGVCSKYPSYYNQTSIASQTQSPPLSKLVHTASAENGSKELIKATATRANRHHETENVATHDCFTTSVLNASTHNLTKKLSTEPIAMLMLLSRYGANPNLKEEEYIWALHKYPPPDIFLSNSTFLL